MQNSMSAELNVYFENSDDDMFTISLSKSQLKGVITILGLSDIEKNGTYKCFSDSSVEAVTKKIKEMIKIR